MRDLLLMVGLPDLQTMPMVLLLAVIVLSGLLLGWIADLLLGPAAFGTIRNTLIVLVGAFAGAWLWQRYGFPTRFDPAATRTGVAVGAGLFLLLVATLTLP